MRSCKYTYVGKGERKTRPIKLRDIVFRNSTQVLSNEDESLHSAETVSIYFGEHKLELKDETVSQDRNDKSGLNPVKLYAGIVRRIRSYQNVSDNWPIFTFFDG